jgi:hypothetical protein
MPDLGVLEPIALGILGGPFSEFIQIFDLRRHKVTDWPYWVRLRSYWILTIGMVVAGAMLVIIHERAGTSFVKNPWLALNIGASAPLLLRQLGAGAGTPVPKNLAEVD